VSDKSKEEDDILLLTHKDPAKDTRKLHDDVIAPELLGFVHFGEPLGRFVVVELLESIQAKISKGRKNGIDLVLITGTKTDVNLNVEAWFDPAQKFALRGMSLTRTGAIKPGDIVSYSFFFDKYTVVKSVPLPTECHWTLKQINPDNGKEHVENETTYFSDFSIADNSNPQPFAFVTEIPNGTKVIAKDARHIDHVWFDGKIVPRTDEVMLAIARGGHKFMPGPETPRFWVLLISILMILVGGGRLAYRYFVKGEKL
jgi:hypothetical protein